MVLTDQKRNHIFINIIIACIASSMLATALTTALPPILEDFSISATTGQWITSGYSLAMGIMTPMAQVLLLSIYPPEKKGTVMGGYGLPLSL